MLFENYFEPLSNDSEQASISFTGDDLFDFAGASGDRNPTSVESLDALSSSFFEDASCYGMEHAQSFSSQESSLDSFGSDDTFSSLHSDMSLWAVENFNQQPEEMQREWPSSPPVQTQSIPISNTNASVSHITQTQDVCIADSIEFPSLITQSQDMPVVNPTEFPFLTQTRDVCIPDLTEFSSPIIQTQDVCTTDSSAFSSPPNQIQNITVTNPGASSSPPTKGQGVQRKAPSTPPTKARNITIANSVTRSPPIVQSTEQPPRSDSVSPIGPIEALWRPVMGYSPPTARPLPRAIRQNKVTKSPKKKKGKTAASSGAKTAAAPRERSVQDLYNSTWATLTQEEKGRLLLPLLQGIDPLTGKKTGKAGTLLPATNLESVGANMSTQRMQTWTPSANATFNELPTQCNNADYAAIGAGYVPPHSNTQQLISDTNLDAIRAFNQRCTNTHATRSSNLERLNHAQVITIPDSPEIGASTTVVRGPHGPCNNNNNNVMANVVQMPAPPAVYGCTRQQEALQRNAMLAAQGRRR